LAALTLPGTYITSPDAARFVTVMQSLRLRGDASRASSNLSPSHNTLRSCAGARADNWVSYRRAFSRVEEAGRWTVKGMGSWKGLAVEGMGLPSRRLVAPGDSSVSRGRSSSPFFRPLKPSMSTIQEYIDKHNLAKEVEEVVNACSKARAEEPAAFMAEFLKGKTPASITKVRGVWRMRLSLLDAMLCAGARLGSLQRRALRSDEPPGFS
jgi:hypothetical protein